MERKYSVSEIDDMRTAVRQMLVGRDDAKQVEERLRTYMLNGTEPAELREAADEAGRRWIENMRIGAKQSRMQAGAFD